MLSIDSPRFSGLNFMGRIKAYAIGNPLLKRNLEDFHTDLGGEKPKALRAVEDWNK